MDNTKNKRKGKPILTLKPREGVRIKAVEMLLREGTYDFFSQLGMLNNKPMEHFLMEAVETYRLYLTGNTPEESGAGGEINVEVDLDEDLTPTDQERAVWRSKRKIN